MYVQLFAELTDVLIESVSFALAKPPTQAWFGELGVLLSDLLR